MSYETPGGVPVNGDTKLILHRIGSLETLLVKISEELNEKVTVGDERLRSLEVNQAVLTRAQHDCASRVCGEIDELKADIKRNDIVGSVLGAIGAWIAAVLTYFGLQSR